MHISDANYFKKKNIFHILISLQEMGQYFLRSSCSQRSCDPRGSFKYFFHILSIFKKWDNVFCDPVVVKAHVPAWYRVENKLARLVQAFQT